MTRQERFTEEARQALEEFYGSMSAQGKGYVNKIRKNNKAVLRSLRQHILEGEPGGSFVEALLKNDFMGAANRADNRMKRCLPELATYLSMAPSMSRGSEEVVKEWREKGGLIGIHDGDVYHSIQLIKRDGL